MALAATSLKTVRHASTRQGSQAVLAQLLPTALSLFSGGGGLDIGVEQAGFRTLACVEIDPNCCETLRYNQMKYMSDARIINEDVRKVNPRRLMAELGLDEGDLNLLYGGPPCQAFSQIGKMDGLGDDRGKLLFEMVRFAKVFRPKAIIIENVKALLGAKDPDGVPGGIIKKLKADLGRLRLSCSVRGR